jgi:hypothetical protein
MRELNTSMERAFFVTLLLAHFQEISISSLPAFPFLFLSSPSTLSRCTLRKLKRGGIALYALALAEQPSLTVFFPLFRPSVQLFRLPKGRETFIMPVSP